MGAARPSTATSVAPARRARRARARANSPPPCIALDLRILGSFLPIYATRRTCSPDGATPSVLVARLAPGACDDARVARGARAVAVVVAVSLAACGAGSAAPRTDTQGAPATKSLGASPAAS